MGANDYKIQRFEIENVGKVRRLKCELHGGSAIFAGAPNVGKTTILETIQYLITGRKTDRFDPEKMVRRGAEKAEAEMLLRNDDGHAFTCRMVVKDGKPALKVVGVKKSEDGYMRLRRDDVKDFIHTIGLDLNAFRLLKPKEQVDKLLESLGLKEKLDALNEERERAYNERRDINRDIKNLNGEIDAFEPLPPDLPADFIDETLLLKRIQAAHVIMAQVQTLQEKIKEARENIVKLEAQLGDISAFESPKKLEADLILAQTTNRAIEERERRARKYERLEDLVDKAGDLTARIAEIDSEKTGVLEAAKLPIRGLGFGDEGITLHGNPLINEGESMQLRTVFALAAAILNAPAEKPKIRVLTLDGGESIGKSGVQECLGLAKEYNVPLLLTYVSEEEGEIDGAIYIQDAE